MFPHTGIARPAWNCRPKFQGWVILGVLTAGILVTFTLLAWRDLDSRYEIAARQGHDTTWFISRNVGEKLHMYDLQVQSVAAEIANNGGGVPGARAEAVWHLIALAMQSTPFIRSISVYDRDGRIVQHSDTRNGNETISVADREHFQRLRSDPSLGTIISRPIKSRVHGDLIVGVARALRTPDGGFDGVILLAVRPEALDLSAGLASLPPGSAVAVHTLDGTNLFRAPVILSEIGRDMSSTPLFTQALPASPVGTTRTPDGGSPIDGHDRIIAYRTLDGWPLVVTAGIKGAAVVKEWRNDWSRNALLVGLALVGFCWLAVVAQRQVTGRLQAELALSQRELQVRIAMEDELRRWATTDSLTGLNNRRHFLELAEREMQRATRHQHPLSVLIFDVDFFKNINDRFGHATGDQALRLLAEVARTVLRESDIVGRLGGEEFGVLLPETDLAGAAELAERLRASVAALDFRAGETQVEIHVSVGAAALRNSDTCIDGLLARADHALYDAKNSGRNQVAVD